MKRQCLSFSVLALLKEEGNKNFEPDLYTLVQTIYMAVSILVEHMGSYHPALINVKSTKNTYDDQKNDDLYIEAQPMTAGCNRRCLILYLGAILYGKTRGIMAPSPDLIFHIAVLIFHIPDLIFHIPDLILHIPELVFHIPDLIFHIPDW